MFGQAIWGHIWKRTVEKFEQMQPMWLFLFRSKIFEETFENAQCRKEKKSYRCDFAYVRAGNLMTHLKTHSGKIRTNATSRNLYQSKLTHWGSIWKHTVEKNQINATNATLPLLRQAIWGHIWKRTVEKNQTNATNVTPHLLRQAIWGHIWKCIVESN